MKLPIYLIDTFTMQVFSGNPAAVCPLEDWLDEGIMQRIATENHVTTAFFVRKKAAYELRWFTPLTEIQGICGHGTLAAAFVIANELEDAADEVRFTVQAGDLRVRKVEGHFILDFPTLPVNSCSAPALLAQGLGQEPAEVLASVDFLVVFEAEEQVAQLRPRFDVLKGLPLRGIIATAPGNHVDFVSRWFAPNIGVNEDAVTGSAHCTLTPFWAGRLGKLRLQARQLSERGGELDCELRDSRVWLRASAVKYLTGEIEV